MKVLYFAWLREKAGVAKEDVVLPKHVATVQDLVNWLVQRGEGYEAAFADLSVVRVAVNQEHVALDHSIADGDEVAFFPPVTGG
jgi:molybdopterin synthase sulfur carrier subunit